MTVNYALFSGTNQISLINSFIAEKIVNILGNFIVHISSYYRFFYSQIIHAIAILINFGISFIIVTRMINTIDLCSLFNNYYSKSAVESNKTKMNSTCSKQIILYMSWLGVNLITILLKLIAINFSYRSHTLIKKLTKRKKKKK